MSSRTRYFVIASLLVLIVGLGTGLVAYYAGFSTSAFTAQGGPEELKFVPSGAALVAFADVQKIMASDVRQKARVALPTPPHGQQDFQNQTGINIETDIDRVVAFMVPAAAATAGRPGSGMVLARGRFDEVKIEALMREHGGQVEVYKGKRLIVGQASPNTSASVAFIEPGLVAVGTTDMVRGAVDLRDGGASIVTNDEMMDRIRDLDAGDAWVAGRFDVLAAHARIPAGLSEHLPPITWFSANVNVDGGVRGAVRAETRDDDSATNLRDVIRGFMALAKLQAGARPEFQTMMQSLQLSGSGKTVALSFDVPAAVFDAVGALAGQHRLRPPQPSAPPEPPAPPQPPQ